MGYTNKEYIIAFAEYHKFKRLTIYGEVDKLDISPLIPFILADSGYNYYMKFVRPLKLKHEMNKLRNELIKDYNEFNRELFAAFEAKNPDMVGEFIEKMDAFLEKMTDYLRIVRVDIIQVLPGELPFNVREVLAAILMFNHLCHCGYEIYFEVFKKKKPSLEKLQYHSEKLATLYLKQHGSEFSGLAPDKLARIQKDLDTLYRHIVDWIVKDMNEN